jgi:hypothetical protein
MEIAPCCCAVWFLAISVLVVLARELFQKRPPRVPALSDEKKEDD